jgi:hypothetical protein
MADVNFCFAVFAVFPLLDEEKITKGIAHCEERPAPGAIRKENAPYFLTVYKPPSKLNAWFGQFRLTAVASCLYCISRMR